MTDWMQDPQKQKIYIIQKAQRLLWLGYKLLLQLQYSFYTVIYIFSSQMQNNACFFLMKVMKRLFFCIKHFNKTITVINTSKQRTLACNKYLSSQGFRNLTKVRGFYNKNKDNKQKKNKKDGWKKWIIIRSMLMHVKVRQGSHLVQDIIFHFIKAILCDGQLIFNQHLWPAVVCLRK